MTGRHDLDKQLSAFLREGPTDLPDPSFDAVRDRIEQTRQRAVIGSMGVPDMNKFLAIGLGAAAVVLAGYIGIQLVGGPAPGGPAPGGPAPVETLAPVQYGWPTTTQNQAGVYSWDGVRCGSSCVMGFMHNGYGSGDVEIRVGVRLPDAGGGGTAVVVAGYDGTYRRIDAEQEEWMVEIEGTTILIQLTARPGTSEADLADAHAIIDSMRTEARANRMGFRLVFTLTNDDWDSG